MFSHYPGGRAAYGLLVLRLVLAARLENDGGERILRAIDSGVPDEVLIGVGFALAGGLLAAGLFTHLVAPCVACLALVIMAGRVRGLGFLALSTAPWNLPLLDIGMAISLALIGPGAFSIDSRWFGRREIVIPPSVRHLMRDRSVTP